MKIRCNREMKKHGLVEEMRMNWRIECAQSNRKNFKKIMKKYFKNKWKKEADRQMKQEIEENE